MVKFEGMAGLKLNWILTTLRKELNTSDESVIKRAFVEVVFAFITLPDLLDGVADYITDNYDLD